MRKILFVLPVLAVVMVSCNSEQKVKEVLVDEKPDQAIEVVAEELVEPNNHLAMFEIPAADIDRAIEFYKSVLDMEIEKMEMPGMEMGILPYENQVITGVIMKAEGYVPSPNGITVYLNAGNDLQPFLDRVEENGGQIILPKTAHADESGFFALFLDSEGNKMGLNSPN